MISFPFDSQITGTDEAGLPIYDRASNSEDLARWFEAFFTNGIFATSGFSVTVSGLTVSVAPGDCLINGRYGYEKNARTFSIAGGGSQPRIDTVVLRLDLSLDKRNIDLFVKTGTAATTPVAPALERNEIVWELGVANIRVNAAQTAVSQSAVTDTRLDTSRCGIVAQAMKTIDTTTYYNQIQADLAYFKETEQESFNQWFESVRDTLDDDTAGNLLNMINAINAEIDNLKPGDIGAAKVAVNTAAIFQIADWSGDAAPYTNTVSVEGILESDKPIIDLVFLSTDTTDELVELRKENWALVDKIETGDGTLTAYSYSEIPTRAIKVNVLVVR